MNIKDEQTGEQTGDKKDEPTGEQTRPPLQWEYRTELKINARMRELISMTKAVTEAEVDRLRRKIEKLKYGS